MCLSLIFCVQKKNQFEKSEQRFASGPGLMGFRAPITQLTGLEIWTWVQQWEKTGKVQWEKKKKKKRCFPFKSFCNFIADFSFISSFSFVLVKQDRWDVPTTAARHCSQLSSSYMLQNPMTELTKKLKPCVWFTQGLFFNGWFKLTELQPAQN